MANYRDLDGCTDIFYIFYKKVSYKNRENRKLSVYPYQINSENHSSVSPVSVHLVLFEEFLSFTITS